ncbi:hypothetical protein LIA77_00468 [Sarocladium implicatum]|nr:hypothetical protein LIA77_00468 [Sarocladium implicatum]
MVRMEERSIHVERFSLLIRGAACSHSHNGNVVYPAVHQEQKMTLSLYSKTLCCAAQIARHSMALCDLAIGAAKSGATANRRECHAPSPQRSRLLKYERVVFHPPRSMNRTSPVRKGSGISAAYPFRSEIALPYCLLLQWRRCSVARVFFV